MADSFTPGTYYTGNMSYDFVPGTYYSSPGGRVPGVIGAVNPLAARIAAQQQQSNELQFTPVNWTGIGYATDPAEGMGEFRKGWHRGIEQSQAMLYGAAGAIGDIIGADGLRDWGIEGYTRNMEEAAQYAPAVEGFTSIRGVGDAANWIAGTTGELLPTMIGALASGGVGTGMAKTVGARLLRNWTAKQIEKNIAANVAKGMAADQAVAVAAKQAANTLAQRGSMAGLVGFTAASEGGGNYGRDVESHGRAGTSPGMDMMFGLVSGMAEAVMGAESSLLRSIIGRPVSEAAEQSFRKILVNQLPKAMMKESATEAFQEIASAMNANIQDAKGLITADDINDIVNAAAAGALGGGMFHPMTSYFESRNSKKQATQNVADGKSDVNDSTNALNNPADLQQIQQDMAAERQPFETALAQADEYLKNWDTYSQEQINQFDKDWDKEEKSLLDKFAKVWSKNPNLYGLEERNQDLLERSKEFSKRKQKYVTDLIGKWTQLQDEKKAARKALEDRLNKGYRAQDGKLITAAYRQAQENLRQQQALDAATNGAIQATLQDAVIYSQKTNQSIDTGIRTIDQVIGIINDSMNREANAGTLTVLKEKLYNRYLNKLRWQRSKLTGAKRKLAKATTKVMRNASSLSSETLGNIGLDIQEMRDIGDSAIELGRPASIFSEVDKLSIDQATDAFNQIRDVLNTSIRQMDNITNKDQALAAKQLLRSTELSYAGMDLQRNMPLPNRQAPVQQDVDLDTRLEQEDQKNRQYIDNAFNTARRQDNLERAQALQRNEQVQNLYDIANATGQRANNMPGWNSANEEDVAGWRERQQAQQQQAQAQAQQQGNTAGQVDEVVQRTREASAEAAQVQVADEQQNHQSIATSVLSQDPQFKLQLTRVINWLNNTLNTLPALRDNVVLCVNGTDPVLPIEVQNALTDYNCTPKGVYWNGKIYMFASNLTNKSEAVRTLIHEGVAHFGLRSIMTDVQLGRFLDLVFNNFKGTKEWRDFAANRPEYFQRQDRVTQAEEFVAYIAEQMKPSQLVRPTSIFTRIVQFFKNVLSTLGLRDLTVNDIRNVLAASAENLSNKNATGLRDAIQSIDVMEVSGARIRVPVEDGPVYGIKFDSAEDSVVYYKTLEASRSGNTNTPYILNYPKNSNTLNLNDTISQQPQPVQARLQKLLRELGVEPNAQVEQDGSVTILFNKQPIRQGLTQEQATSYLDQNQFIEDVTGGDVYAFLAENLGSRRDATIAMREYGIRGAQFVENEKNNYYLFEGNKISSAPFKYDLAKLSEPKFLVTEDTPADEITIDPVTGEQTTVDTEDERTYLNTLYSDTSSQTSALEKLAQVRRTGKSTDRNGNLIEHSWWERFVEYWVDPNRRLYIVQKYIKEKLPGIINGTTNVYKELQGLSNRINQLKCDMSNQFWEPILEAMKKIDIDIPVYDKDGNVIHTFKKTDKKYADAVVAMVDDVLRARHAKERNASINARMKGVRYTYKDKATGEVKHGHKNAKTPGQGGTLINPSGMSDAMADSILQRYRNVAGLDEVLSRVDRMNKYTLDLMLKHNLITQEAYDRMSQYEFYVPLRGWEEMQERYFPGYYRARGKSMSTGGKNPARYAKGRDGALPESPFMRSYMQMLDMVALTERNEVMRKFGELVKQTSAKDKSLFEFDEKNPEALRLQVMKDGNIGFVTKPTEHQGSGEGTVTYIDKNGDVKRVVIHDKWLASAMRGENSAPVTAFMEFMRKYTGLMTQLMTARNPVFAIINPIRDLPTALLNIQSSIEENEMRGLLSKEQEIVKGVLKDITSGNAYRLLWNVSRTDTKGVAFDASKFSEQDVADLRDWRAYGGHTRMLDYMQIEDLGKRVRSELRHRGPIGSALKSTIEYMDMLSDTTENMTRFSVYKHFMKAFRENMRERAKVEGWDEARWQEELHVAKQKSANIALECTVNFTKKGAGASVYNPLWAFSSASVQSFARIATNLWRPTSTPVQNFKRVSKFVAGGVAFPMMWNQICRSIMGDDDDGLNKFDKIPSYIRYTHLIIPMPFGDGGYVKIPLPYGYNVFTAAGAIFDDVIHGNTSAATGSANLMKIAISGVSPVDPSDQGLIAFVPTLFKPFAEVAANVTFTGAPIMPSGPGVENVPNYLKSWATTPQMFKDAAGLLNFISGGWVTKDGIGMLDISPETIEHITNSYLGGIGRIFQQGVTLAMSGPAGYDIQAKDIPVISRLYSKVGYDNTNALYNRFNDKVNQAKVIKDMASNNPDSLRQARSNFAGELSLEKLQTKVTGELNKIKQAERALRKKYPAGTRSQAFNNQLRLIQQRKERVMKRFNAAAKRAGLEMD